MYKYLSKKFGTLLEVTLVVIFLIALFPVLEIEKTANIQNEKLNTKYTYNYQVIETFVGPLTGYGPDCYGCVSGKTATDHDAYQMYYNDSTYGSIRVIAADPSFPFYSVFRISNVPNMEPFLAIVLDRGGNVGFGKGTLFDLLYPSEAEALHKTDNITFELIRKGQ